MKKKIEKLALTSFKRYINSSVKLNRFFNSEGGIIRFILQFSLAIVHYSISFLIVIAHYAAILLEFLENTFKFLFSPFTLLAALIIDSSLYFSKYPLIFSIETKEEKLETEINYKTTDYCIKQTRV